MPLYKPQNSKITEFENEVTLSNDSTTVNIGISQYNQNNDILMVHKNSIFLKNGVDYTVSGSTIVAPNGVTWTNGTVFDFLVIKNMQSTVAYTDGSLIQSGSVGNAQLAPDAKVGSLPSLQTTAKDSAVSAINETSQKIGVLSGLQTPATDLVTAINDKDQRLGNLSGLNENTISYVYNTDGSVQTATEKDKNNNVISTTTFTYKANGDVDTSVIVMNGQTITTQYNYDSNGNLQSTANTKS